MVIRTLRLVRGARHSPAPSVIHANDFDTLPAGWLIRRRTGARLVYDSHEIYSSLEPNPPRVSQWLALQVERALARRADAVVTTGDEYADALVRILRLESRPLIARNCPERSEERPFSSGTGALRVIYQAAMSPGRRIEDILVAAENAPGVEITLRVVGADYPGLAREIARRGIEERLKLAPPVPADKLVDALDGFDVGLIINRPVTLTDELVCPNKLFEYMMAGLAVAAPRLPELARIIDGEEVGVTFPPGEPEELGRALASLAERREDVLELRRRARSVALLRYTAEAQVPALLQAWAVVPRSVAPTSA
jgi:glycosyltransferase involved in cell wall biosynthesis